ncbi:UNVERIFIED_CONTAM: MAR-binding filament-like protein 1-1 [Sesamum angustifolium]|uniref:MAR-binding filament-like protein 1-1 n=1 Tax=Sesamum angustifolium TaxID=2727405 RepID=A0AAW2RJX1_9LAMI
MGFATGSSSFLHHSLFLPPSSPCILQPPFSPRNGLTPRKNRTAISCSQQEITPKDEDFCKRRAILFVGFSLIPLLNMRAEAVEGIAAESTEVRTLDQKQKQSVCLWCQQSGQGKPSQNPFLSLLNGLGFLGSGVLAALYASLKKEKAASDETIESINVKLKEKEATISFLEKKFESELLNEKEARNKALAKANEEKQSLVNQLDLANRTITSLGQDLRKEKSLVEEQTIQVEHLEVSLQKAGDEKRQLQQVKEKLDSVAALQERVNSLSSEIKDKDDDLQNVNSKLVEKERELSQLNSIYQQAQEQLSSLNSEIQQLKDVLQEKEKELELKNVALKNLKAELASSLAERDESHKKLDAVLKEYDQFKSSAEKKAALDAKLLGEREEALHQLEEQLEKELKITQESLENSRSEASELSKQLHESRVLCSELEDKVSRIEVEFSETRDSLQREVNEVKLGAEVIDGELRSTKELLSKSNDELQMISRELADKVQRCESLEKNSIIPTGKQKVQLLLWRELELASSRISSIEDEKEALYRSLDEQKQVSQEARENLEDAHNLIMRLGNERDGLEKRGKETRRGISFRKGRNTAAKESNERVKKSCNRSA